MNDWKHETAVTRSPAGDGCMPSRTKVRDVASCFKDVLPNHSVACAASFRFRQADLLAQRLQPRIAAQQRKSRRYKNVPSHPNRAQPNHALQSFERAVLVAQSREDGRFRQGPRHNDSDSLCFLPTAGLRIGYAK